MEPQVDIRSPIDRQIAANNLARRNPTPDPNIRRLQEARKMDRPPESFRNLGARSDEDHTPASKFAASALQTAYDSWALIHEASQDLSLPGEKLAKAAEGAIKKADGAIRGAKATVEGHLSRYEAAIMEKAAPKISDARAVELRSFLRSQDASKIGSLVRSNPEFSSALMNAPKELSGVDKTENYDALVESAKIAHAPDDVAKRDDTRKVMDQLERAESLISTKLVKKLMDWTPEENDALKRLGAL